MLTGRSSILSFFAVVFTLGEMIFSVSLSSRSSASLCDTATAVGPAWIPSLVRHAGHGRTAFEGCENRIGMRSTEHESFRDKKEYYTMKSLLDSMLIYWILLLASL